MLLEVNDTHTDISLHGCETHTTSILGILGELNVEIGSLSIFGVVALILCIEKILEYLDVLTEDTPFQGMIVSIEKELMTVGTMAFVAKVGLNSLEDQEWKHAIEYAGLY